jgi:hypothetical protein
MNMLLGTRTRFALAATALAVVLIATGSVGATAGTGR